MASMGVVVLCYWNGRVEKRKPDVVYEGEDVKMMPMKLDYGTKYGELLDKIYAVTRIEKHKFELNIICRYPISPEEYKAVPISNDEAVQVILELPSRNSKVYGVELFLEKQALVGRKWEDLDMDCLVNVFQKVGLESLMLNVPFVCKSWYNASLDRNCWKILNFRKDFMTDKILRQYAQFFKERFGRNDKMKITAIMKFVVNRSHGCATTLELPNCYTKEGLEYAANKCPSLKSLAFPPRPYRGDISRRVRTINPGVISKFKKLEVLEISKIHNIKEILAQIGIHCNNFIKLSAPGLRFLKDEASAIVTSLPKIRYLDLRKANFVTQKNLLMILDGCRDLIHLDVSNCIGFEEDDIEILERASHIPEFICEGSTSGASAFASAASDSDSSSSSSSYAADSDFSSSAAASFSSFSSFSSSYAAASFSSSSSFDSAAASFSSSSSDSAAASFSSSSSDSAAADSAAADSASDSYLNSDYSE